MFRATFVRDRIGLFDEQIPGGCTGTEWTLRAAPAAVVVKREPLSTFAGNRLVLGPLAHHRRCARLPARRVPRACEQSAGLARVRRATGLLACRGRGSQKRGRIERPCATTGASCVYLAAPSRPAGPSPAASARSCSDAATASERPSLKAAKRLGFLEEPGCSFRRSELSAVDPDVVDVVDAGRRRRTVGRTPPWPPTAKLMRSFIGLSAVNGFGYTAHRRSRSGPQSPTCMCRCHRSRTPSHRRSTNGSYCPPTHDVRVVPVGRIPGLCSLIIEHFHRAIHAWSCWRDTKRGQHVGSTEDLEHVGHRKRRKPS